MTRHSALHRATATSCPHLPDVIPNSLKAREGPYDVGGRSAESVGSAMSEAQAFVHGAPRPHSKHALKLDPSPAFQAGSG